MKKIECIIQNKKLSDLEHALRMAGVGGMTVSEVKGFGNEQTRPDPYLFLPKTKVEIYCADEALDGLVDTICKVCQTGQLGDGKIAVFDVLELVRIRTGVRGEVAV
jgi:nitrogen regulatory protein P-II 1